MLIVRSRSAAHALLDIVQCTMDDPRLPDIVESSLAATPEEPALRRRQVERALEAVRAIRAACPEEPSRGMRVPIDVRDPAVRAALQAMLLLYRQWIETDREGGLVADAMDIAEIQSTIHASLEEDSGFMLPV